MSSIWADEKLWVEPVFQFCGIWGTNGWNVGQVLPMSSSRVASWPFISTTTTPEHAYQGARVGLASLIQLCLRCMGEAKESPLVEIDF